MSFMQFHWRRSLQELFSVDPLAAYFYQFFLAVDINTFYYDSNSLLLN